MIHAGSEKFRKDISKDNKPIIDQLKNELEADLRSSTQPGFFARNWPFEAGNKFRKELNGLKRSAEEFGTYAVENNVPLGFMPENGINEIKGKISSTTRSPNSSIDYSIIIEQNEEVLKAGAALIDYHGDKTSSRKALYEISKDKTADKIRNVGTFLNGMEGDFKSKKNTFIEAEQGREILNIAANKPELGATVARTIKANIGSLGNDSKKLMNATEACLNAQDQKGMEIRAKFIKEECQGRFGNINGEKLEKVSKAFDTKPNFGDKAIKDYSKAERREMSAHYAGQHPNLYEALNNGYEGKMTNRQFIAAVDQLKETNDISELNNSLKSPEASQAFTKSLIEDKVKSFSSGIKEDVAKKAISEASKVQPSPQATPQNQFRDSGKDRGSTRYLDAEPLSVRDSNRQPYAAFSSDPNRQVNRIQAADFPSVPTSEVTRSARSSSSPVPRNLGGDGNTPPFGGMDSAALTQSVGSDGSEVGDSRGSPNPRSRSNSSDGQYGVLPNTGADTQPYGNHAQFTQKQPSPIAADARGQVAGQNEYSNLSKLMAQGQDRANEPNKPTRPVPIAKAQPLANGQLPPPLTPETVAALEKAAQGTATRLDGQPPKKADPQYSNIPDLRGGSAGNHGHGGRS